MYFIDDRMDYVEYKHINITILDGNFTNFSLIFNKGNFGVIYSNDTSCHGSYIIIFTFSPYTLQEDLNIYVQVIYFGEMVLRVHIFYP